MTSKEAIEKISKMIFGDVPSDPKPVPAVEPAKFADYKTKDGVVLSIDKVEVGGSVVLNGQPAADGEYILEDATKISVSGGVISEVEKGEEVPPVPGVEMPEEMKQLPSKFSEMQSGFDAQKSEIDELKKVVEHQKETIKEMFALVEKLAEAPIEKPTEKVKTFDEMSPLEQFRATKRK